MRSNFTINPDEHSPEFKAHLAERIKLAQNLRNSVPVDQFFRKRQLSQTSISKKLKIEPNKKVRQYAAV